MTIGVGKCGMDALKYMITTAGLTYRLVRLTPKASHLRGPCRPPNVFYRRL